jgi:hypothetical protein
MEKTKTTATSRDSVSTKESEFQAPMSEKKLVDGWLSSEAPSTNIAESEKNTDVLKESIDESPAADEESANYLTGFKLAIILTATCLSVFLVALVCTLTSIFSCSITIPSTDHIPG